MARQPTVIVAGALETEGGRAIAGDVIELLEAELVRFRHRVAHDHGISVERARAALVMLTRVVDAGASWRAGPDAAPRAIFDSFIELMTRAEATWPSGLAEALHAELAEFLNATKSVAISDPPAHPTIADLVRGAGAAPEAWWWASQFDDTAECWRAAAPAADRLVTIALAVGAPAERVSRTLAGALAVAATRVKTRRGQQRTELAGILDRLASGSATFDANDASVAKLTALAFQLAAAQDKDPLGALAVLAFQLVELARGAATRPDLERYAELAAKAQRLLHAQGIQLPTLLKQELDPLVAPAEKVKESVPRRS